MLKGFPVPAINSPQSRFETLLDSFVAVAFILHFAYIFIFNHLQITNLVTANFVSVSIYLGCIILRTKHKNYPVSYLLCIFELIGHAALAVKTVGLEGGFQYYLFILPVFIFLHPARRIWTKSILTISILGVFMWLHFSMKSLPPEMLLPDEILHAFEVFNLVAFTSLLVALAHLYSQAASDAEERLQKANSILDLLARTDPLTGLLNRRSMLEFLITEVGLAQTIHKPFSVIMCDIDDFKAINDRFGHICGDKLLVEIANTLVETIRPEDQVARWGGEEFLVFLPETPLREAVKIAENLRNRVQALQIPCNGDFLHGSITLGVSEYQPPENINSALIAADQALYRGKQKGKNTVIGALH